MGFETDDCVIVVRSKSGYAGPGRIVCRAYGMMYVVEVEFEKQKIILVRASDMKKDHSRSKKGAIKNG